MKNEESILQRACVRWFRLQYPTFLIFAIPNGGSRHLLEARKMKDEGVLAGVADLQVITPNKTFFVEMKATKGKQSKTQKEFQQRVENNGFKYFLCNSFDSFQKIVKEQIANI